MVVLGNAKVYYQGIGDADAVNKVMTATRAYLNTLSGVDNFDGVYVRNDHIARVRQEVGIVDFEAGDIAITPDGGSSVYVASHYESESGHFLLSEIGNTIYTIAV